MLQSIFHLRPPIPTSAFVVIRRLVVEFGLAQWRRYAMAFVLMGVAAACTAIPVYLIGDMVNMANIEHNFPGGGRARSGSGGDLRDQGGGDLRAIRDPVAHRQPHHRARTSAACSASCSTRASAFSPIATLRNSPRGS